MDFIFYKRTKIVCVGKRDKNYNFLHVFIDACLVAWKIEFVPFEKLQKRFLLTFNEH